MSKWLPLGLIGALILSAPVPKRKDWLTHQADGVFVCVTFGYVPDLKGATKLWEVLSDENHEPSIERLLSVYKQATGIEIAALPLH